jgi:NADPH:quinone reductase-like Zn-dependent oxidoreductase
MMTGRRLALAASCLAALSLAAPAPAQAPAAAGAPRMKAVVYRSYGAPEVLRLEEVERPVPDDHQLLVRVRAASVNPLDWHYMRGAPFFGRLGMGLSAPTNPRLGVDFAGTVEAVGNAVTRFKPGDEVFGGRTGAFAEYVTVREDRAVALKPPNVTFEEAAAVPIAATTALQGLRDEGRLRAGQRVLVNGASGGVGTFAVQLAKALGASVTGVCSTRNVELVRSLGADRVLDYTREDFTRGGERYDVVLDNVGNRSLLEVRRALEPAGTYVMIGGPAGTWIEPLPRVAKDLVLSRFVSQDVRLLLADLNQKDLAFLAELMAAGKLRPAIDRRYGLGQLAEAVRYVEAGHARGKVVVTLDDGARIVPVRADVASPPGGGADGVFATFVAVVAAVVVVPIAAALALNRRFQRRNPGKRPYRWGYWVSALSVLGGIALGVVLDAGAVAAVACGAAYALLAWSFARRRRWAWVALTALTFNPFAWAVNAVYLRKRWTEDSAVAPTP